jgi:hypothetical protein
MFYSMSHFLLISSLFNNSFVTVENRTHVDTFSLNLINLGKFSKSSLFLSTTLCRLTGYYGVNSFTVPPLHSCKQKLGWSASTRAGREDIDNITYPCRKGACGSVV